MFQKVLNRPLKNDCKFIKGKDFSVNFPQVSLRKKCPYSELFWSLFSRIRTEHGEILRISPYSMRTWENTDQNNSGCGHFSLSVC